MIAGVPGFGFGSGEVYGVHVAWSGNTVHRVERVPSGLGMTGGPDERLVPGVTTIGGGELLLPGEVTLAEGESYATPWVYLAASRSGLDGLAAQFHQYLRSLPAHPGSPRPVNLNVWEAVYFRHDFAKLAALADIAADVGVERYVLDDGWFTGRRNDRAALGDWQVDEHVWLGACTGSRHTCAGAACSSGCGSSRRWSTRIPSCTVRTRTGSSRPAGDGRRCSDISWYST